MNRLIPAAVVASGLILSACGSSSSSTSAASPVSLSIQFKAMAGSEPISCGETIAGLGLAGTDAKLADFRMFVHDIKLIADQNLALPFMLDENQSGQNADVALLDLRDKAEVVGDSIEVCAEADTENSSDNPNFKDTVTGSVSIDPAYTISHIQFTLGVPFSLNHADQSSADEPLRNPGLATGMHWNWQNGYKFTAFDVRPVGGVTRPADGAWSSQKWNLHLGSTGCSVGVSDLNNGVEPEPCTAPNRTVVTLPLGGVALEKIAINVDYAALIAMSNLAEDNGGAPGCMSGGTDPECEDIFGRLGLPWGSNAAVEQSVFSIVEF